MSATELYRKYRPATLEEVVGQDAAVKTLKSLIAKKTVPRALLFHGPAGCGKTTMARILAAQLDVGDGDVQEINCGAVDSPLDMVRDIRSGMNRMGLSGRRRMWILDEFQSFSRARFAQEGMLKILEEPPDHVWFALCTTDPNKIIKAIKSRCTPVTVKPMTPAVLTGLLKSVAAGEGRKLPEAVLKKILELCQASARNALVYLEQAFANTAEEDMLAAVAPVGDEAVAFELVKALIPWKGTPRWPDVAAVLGQLEEQDPEGLRHMVLASARSRLLKDGNPQAFRVLTFFEEPFYNSGHPGLARAAYEACQAK